MDSNPIQLLFSKYHREILSFLLLRPGESFHVRELGRITGLPAGTLNRELKRLSAAGLLTAQRFGNQVRYQSNASHPIAGDLVNVFRKSREHAASEFIFSAAVKPVCERHNVKRLRLFGSAARGTGTDSSDVDFMVEFAEGDAPTLAGLNALKDDLETTCGRRVDLATPAILNNPHRRKAIEKDMEVVYERKGSRLPVGHARRRA